MLGRNADRRGFHVELQVFGDQWSFFTTAPSFSAALQWAETAGYSHKCLARVVELERRGGKWKQPRVICHRGPGSD